MHFWNVKTLARELAEGKVTQTEKMKYLLAYAILSTIVVQLVGWSGEHVSPILILQAVGVLVITVVGILACYQANRKGDGNEFIDRFICLSLPLTLQIGALTFVVYGAYWIAGSLLVGEHFSPTERFFLFEFTVTFLFTITYFAWMRKYILKISTTRRAVQPATEEIKRTIGLSLKSNIKWVLLSLLIFAFGLSTGGYLGFKVAAEPYKFLTTLSGVAWHEQMTQYQYQNGDYVHAKTALLNDIQLHEELRTKGWYEDKYMGSRSYYYGTGLQYGRLFLLEEKAGNNDEKEKAFQEASYRFKMAGWKDYSEAKIRETLAKIDKDQMVKKP